MTSHDEAFEELKQAYIIDLMDDLDLVDSLVMDLVEKNDPNSLLQIKRIVHNHKANAFSFDFRVAAHFFHSFEDELKSGKEMSNSEVESKTLSMLTAVREALNIYQHSPEDSIKGELDKLTARYNVENQVGKVLVVESSKMLAQLYSQSLEKIGLGVSISNDGYEALGRVIVGEFIAIITSQQTAKLTGMSTIAALAQDSRFSSIKTILVTSDPDEFENCIVKPDHIVVKSSQAGHEISNIMQSFIKKK